MTLKDDITANQFFMNMRPLLYSVWYA